MAKVKRKREVIHYPTPYLPAKLDKFGLPVHLSGRNRLKVHSIEEQIRDKLRTIKIHFLEIGKLLSRAKAILLHGNFQQWIEETFGNELSYQSAYQYKRIYELLCGPHSLEDRVIDPYDNNEKVFPHFFDVKRIQSLPLYFLIDLIERGFPSNVKDEICENANAISKDIAKETSSNYKDYKKGIISKKEFIKQTKKLIEGERKKWIDMIQRQTPKGRAFAEKREKKRKEGREKRKMGLRLLHAVEMVEKYIDKIWSYFEDVHQTGALSTEHKKKLMKRIDSMIKNLQEEKDAISKAKTLKL